MPLSDMDQDITPIPRSREENQERYVNYIIYHTGKKKTQITNNHLEPLLLHHGERIAA